MVSGGIFASLVGLLLSTTPPATQLQLPERPVQPNGHVAGGGACMLLALRQLATVGLSTDDGASFRFFRFPTAFNKFEHFTCWQGQYFALSEHAELFRLERETFQRVPPPNAAAPAGFRGLVPAGSKLYAGTALGVLVSSDAGKTFTPVLAGVSALAADDSLLIAARGSEIFGVDASEQLQPLGKLPKPVRALSITKARWFATLENGAVHYSEDQGKTWKRDGGAPTEIREVLQAGSTLIANARHRAWLREKPGAPWRQLTETSRLVPAAKGFWREGLGGPIFRAAAPGDAGTRFTLPSTPLPSVRFLVAHGSAIVTALNYAQELLVSSDLGRSWQAYCEDADFRMAALDGPRLQLASRFWAGTKDCRVPGFKTRIVPELPKETCNGDLCVRFDESSLRRTRDRGKSWQDLSANVGAGPPIVAAAAAGREILIARSTKAHEAVYQVWRFESVLRSTDDGKTFQPFTLPEGITAFAPSERGWLVGTVLHGIALVPYAAAAPVRKH